MARQPCFSGEGAASRLLNRSHQLTPNQKRLWFEIFGFGLAGCWLNDEALARRLYVDASRIRGFRAELVRAGLLRKVGRTAAPGRRAVVGDSWVATFPESLMPQGRSTSEDDLDAQRPRFDQWIEERRTSTSPPPARTQKRGGQSARIATLVDANCTTESCDTQQGNALIAGGAPFPVGEGVGGVGPSNSLYSGSLEPLPQVPQEDLCSRARPSRGEHLGEGDDRSIGTERKREPSPVYLDDQLAGFLERNTGPAAQARAAGADAEAVAQGEAEEGPAVSPEETRADVEAKRRAYLEAAACAKAARAGTSGAPAHVGNPAWSAQP